MSRSWLLLIAALSWSAADAAPPVWREVKPETIPLVGKRLTTPLHARTFEANLPAVRAVLDKAPLEGSTRTRPVLELPLPRAGTIRFRIVESPVMHPELGAKFPQTRTYAGAAVSDPRITGRFQIDPRGFRAILFTPQGTVYIDPFSRGDTRHYQVYYAHELPPKRRAPDTIWQPRDDSGSGGAEPAPAAARTAARGVTIGGELRTYRLAMGATYQYSSFHDPQDPPNEPSKSVVNAEIVNVVNRVTGVYERELGIRLVLVPNNEDAIYTSPVQPYSNGPDMVEVNTIILDQNIGNENYDIGHVASTGGGGIAGLGVVCNDARKGDGVTGLPEPVGDAYYIDFVAHEMGHQFGANHTFNGSEATNCSPNRNPSTAYEPGSGVTIMGYAGVCSEQDIAPHSIDVFHGASFDEIVAYTREGTGDTCPVKANTGNGAPTAEAGTGGFTIPKATPFELTGAACDPDNDPVTYMWEQFDLGPEGHPDEAADADNGQSPPLFRDFLPTTSPTRIFPQPSDLLNNRHTMGEILPNNTRTLNFRLIVRDHELGGGGVGSDDLKFNVTSAAGPFRVTFPDTAADFGGEQAITVTWDVAGTAAAPVSCAAVDLWLSTDGGQTFPILLAAGAANDGDADVILPQVITNAARVKVKCADSIFFDLSNENFRINQQVPTLSVGPDYEDPDTNGRYTLIWERPQGAAGPDTLQVAPGDCGPAFLDDAEAGMGNWTVSQEGLGANAWSTGTTKPGADGATFSASAPDGITDAAALMELKTPYAVPAEGATLSWDEWMATEGDDSNSVEVHDGTEWVTVYEINRPMGVEEATPAFATEAMTARSVDLAPFAGKTIKLRFRYRLGPENRAASSSIYGWHVDNVKLTGVTFADVDQFTGTSHTFASQPVGHYCYRVRTRYVAGELSVASLPSNMVHVHVAQTNLPPVVDVGADFDVDEGAEATLNSAPGTSDPNGDPLTYEWTQISGTPVTLEDATLAAARFTAPALCVDEPLVFQLKATDDSGLFATDQVTVTVRNVNAPPIASAGDDFALDEGASGLLSAAASSDADSCQSLTYEWTQVSGPDVTLDDADTATPSFTAPAVCADTDLVFEVRVGDGTGAFATDAVTVTTRNVNVVPVASAGADFAVDEGASAMLSAAGSSDPDACAAVRYAWTQASGPAVEIGNADSATATFLAPDVTGDTPLTFTVTVTDADDASSTDSVVVTVRDLDPPAPAPIGDNTAGGLPWSTLLLLATLGLGRRRRSCARR